MSTVGGACSASQRVAALVHWEDAALLRFYDSFHVHRSAWDKVRAGWCFGSCHANRVRRLET